MDSKSNFPTAWCSTIVRCVISLAFIAVASVGANATERQFSPQAGETMPVGHGSFDVDGIARGPVTVYSYRPVSAGPESPIWIVMPGARRDEARHLAFDYYDTWQPLAEKYGAILLVPEFTSKKWPGSWAYNIGNVRSRRLEPKPWRQTSFYVVERAFRLAARSVDSRRRKFSMFGHGAGSQFIQRYVLHAGCGMIDRAVSANPGWYLVPDNEFQFPFGLRGAPIPKPTIRRAFACDFTLLLGTADVNTAGLRVEPGAAEQGATRYERGLFYFDRAGQIARRMNAPFRWHMDEVPGVGHEADRMAPAGAAILAGAWPQHRLTRAGE
ncbi:MAG: hydrolase [Hyphomicrobiaceae bacterium]|nr:hydrolase [Hyphomicrobiaceae bacterium]